MYNNKNIALALALLSSFHAPSHSTITKHDALAYAAGGLAVATTICMYKIYHIQKQQALNAQNFTAQIKSLNETIETLQKENQSNQKNAAKDTAKNKQSNDQQESIDDKLAHFENNFKKHLKVKLENLEAGLQEKTATLLEQYEQQKLVPLQTKLTENNAAQEGFAKKALEELRKESPGYLQQLTNGSTDIALKKIEALEALLKSFVETPAYKQSASQGKQIKDLGEEIIKLRTLVEQYQPATQKTLELMQSRIEKLEKASTELQVTKEELNKAAKEILDAVNKDIEGLRTQIGKPASAVEPAAN